MLTMGAAVRSDTTEVTLRTQGCMQRSPEGFPSPSSKCRPSAWKQVYITNSILILGCQKHEGSPGLMGSVWISQLARILR